MRYFVVRPTNALSVAACVEHRFGVLLSPIDIREGRVSSVSGSVHPVAGLPYVLDNGAWACHMAGIEWEPGPMLHLAERLGPASEWMVLPDIVGGGRESLVRSIDFYKQQRPEHVPAWMLAVQDGMNIADVRRLLDLYPLGIFVGGSTDWKWRTAHEWAELGLDLGRRVHVGRVNSQRRIRLCRDLGIASCDGSSVSRFSKNAPGLALFHDGDSPIVASYARHTIAERRFHLNLGMPP